VVMAEDKVTHCTFHFTYSVLQHLTCRANWFEDLAVRNAGRHVHLMNC